MDKTPHNLRIDYDGKWKILIEKAPKLFIQFFLPEIYPQINFNFPPKFMHQDVAKVIGSTKKKGDLVTDLVIEVHLLNGRKKLLYVHIEVQSTPTDNFGEKMFKPFYRLRDKYNQEVTALALFVGEYLPKEYDNYSYQFGKTLVRYEFPTYIVKNKDKQALKQSENPFAVAVLACIYLIETKKKELIANRLALKKELTDFILHNFLGKNFGQDVILGIIDFVVNIMILPIKLADDYNDYYIENYKKIETMYVLTDRAADLADAIFNEIIKKSYRTVIKELQEVEKIKEYKAAKIKAEKATKAAELKAKKATKAAELKAKKATKVAELKAEKATKVAELKAEKAAKAAALKMKEETILKLHFQKAMGIEEIIALFNYEANFVKKVIKNHKK